MPIMSGIEATRIIQQYLKTKRINTYIIGLTGDTDEDVTVKCEEVGMREIVVKPIGIEIVRELLKKYEFL